MRQRSKMIQYWKMADAKAQRNGPHRSVYWVKRKPVQEDGTVKLDGVGGAIILMQASLHREGAYFPPYPFNHSIETEGLAKMTKEMGSQPYGMPMLKIWHK